MSTCCECGLRKGVLRRKECIFAGEIELHFCDTESTGEVREECEGTIEKSHGAHQSIVTECQ
jgi:hypothetical protein